MEESICGLTDVEQTSPLWSRFLLYWSQTHHWCYFHVTDPLSVTRMASIS